MNKYLFTIRPTLKGPYVASWHQVNADDDETKGVLFGMSMFAKVNMAEGPLLINSEEEWTADLLQDYLRSLSNLALREFIEESRLKQSQSL